MSTKSLVSFTTSGKCRSFVPDGLCKVLFVDAFDRVCVGSGVTRIMPFFFLLQRKHNKEQKQNRKESGELRARKRFSHPY